MLRARFIQSLIAVGVLIPICLAAGCADKFERVHKGMMFSDVRHVMGEPKQVVHGEGVETEKTTWIYPQGRVFFEACTVVKVEKSVEESTITERVQRQRDGR